MGRNGVRLLSPTALFAISVASFAPFLSPAEALAVVANSYLPAKEVPSAVCFLEFYDPGSEQGITNPAAGCSGTLIRPNRLLTAAHCLDSFKSGNLTAAIVCNGKFFDIQGYVADPDYIDSDDYEEHVHDVAIIGVSGNTSKITPMPLATSDAEVQSQLAASNNCILAGYGRDDDGTDNSWGTLRAAQFEYLDAETIQQEVGWNVPEQQMFCGPTHAAPGDSGGPVYCPQADGTFLQIGITMLEEQPTSGTMEGDHFSIHESVTFDLEWINSTAELPKLPN